MAQKQTPDAAGNLSLSPRERSLISSAYRVATQQGSHRLSLQDIATDAGVSKGLLLYHFHSKNHLLLITMRWALLRTAERIRSSVATVANGPYTAVQAFIDAVFVGAKQNRDFYLLYLDLIEYTARDQHFKPLSAMTCEIMNEVYVEVLYDATQRGVFTISDINTTAAQMRSYVDGIFLTWVQESHWKKAYERYRTICFNGLIQLVVGDASR